MTTAVAITAITDPVTTDNQTAVVITGTTNVSTNTVAVSVTDGTTTVGPSSATVTGTDWTKTLNLSTLAEGTLIVSAIATALDTTTAFDADITTKATVPPNYATETEFRQFISDPSTTLDAAKIDRSLASASREVDSFCGRYFYQKIETQYFDPDNWWCVSFGDMDIATKSGLTVSTDASNSGTYPDAWVVDVDFVLEPINQSSNGITPWPYESMRSCAARVWPLRYVPWQRPTIKVVATFGWPSLPAPIKQATLMLAAMDYMVGATPLGYASSPDVGAIRIRSNPQISEILRKFSRTAAYGIA